MTEPKSVVLRRTEEQVRGLVQQLVSGHSLPGNPVEGTSWWRLREAVTHAYLDRAERVGVRGGRAIIMAGSPGAGKSRGVAAVREVLGVEESEWLGVAEEGFIAVDADDVKQILLGNPVKELEINPQLLEQARSHWDGLIAEHVPGPLADGKPLLRGELAALTHRLSTATADKVRNRLLAERFNVKIEGTLQWMESPGVGQGPRLIKELEEKQYVQVSIVAVDAPRELCLEGAYRRWVEPRSRVDVRARYTPPEVVVSKFEQGKGVSRCVDNARITHDIARSGGEFEEVNLFIAHRGLQLGVEHVDTQGRVRVYSLGNKLVEGRGIVRGFAPSFRDASQSSGIDV